MAKWWSGIVDMVSNQLVVEDDMTTARRNKVPDLKDAVERARRDWLAAKAYFDNVTDPDLIDHAIYCIEAAEKKYVYLLKQARAEGLRLSLSETEKRLISNTPRVQHHT